VVRLPGTSEGCWVSFHLTPHLQQSGSSAWRIVDGCGWVEHNDRFEQVNGLAHCWVLRRHALAGVFSGCFWPGPPNARACGWWWSEKVGVWLCVECCIVDASILL
jgi:hypothetical protein